MMEAGLGHAFIRQTNACVTSKSRLEIADMAILYI